MTKNVRNFYIMTANCKFRQEKHVRKLWKNLWIVCITYQEKLEKPELRRNKRKKKEEKTEFNG